MNSSDILSKRVASARSDQPLPSPLYVDYIVVAYRSARHIAACLDAIARDRPAGSQVIVVDNCSPDDSADIAQAHPTHPRIITSPTNVGFGAACNLAVRQSSAPMVFFVNPDATLQPEATQLLLNASGGSTNVAVVGPRISDPDGDISAASAGFEPSIRSVAGHFLLFGRLPVIGRFFRPLQLAPGDPERSPDWVSGAALMARRDAFLQVAGFDPSMFMYMEDVDLCRRLREAGWTIQYEPRALVEHLMGGSQGAEQAERWYVAFHSYVRSRRGPVAAAICSLMAATGLMARAVLLRSTKPAHARRLARAGRTALLLAFGRTPELTRRGVALDD